MKEKIIKQTVIDGNLEFDGKLIFADDLGLVEVKGFIKAGIIIVGKGTSIEAGWYIEAGESIEAGWYIKAGGSIEAGTYIKAGEDYGIYASLSVKISLKKEYGYITAKSEPKNIICGFWKPLK